MLKQRSQRFESTGLRSRSRLIFVVIAALALAVIGAGVWMIVAPDGADELAVATDLADDWLEAWNGSDPEAVVALYTEDGVHVPPAAWDLETAQGHDELRDHASAFMGSISESRRTGDVAAGTSEQDFTAPIAFEADGKSFVADIRIVLDGDRASRVEFLTVTDTSLAPATALADEWLALWSGTDAEAIAALYAVDGIHVPPPEWGLPEAVGREAIVEHAEQYGEAINDARRTGDLVSAGPGMVYRFPVRFVASGGTYDGEVELAFDGELASRVEFVTVASG